jgi:uncharacterized OsmC-like protein
MNASGGRLTSEARGEVELSDGVLVLRRIHVRYRIEADRHTDLDQVERVHGFHRARCPVARSIGGAVDITTSYEVV